MVLLIMTTKQKIKEFLLDFFDLVALLLFICVLLLFSICTILVVIATIRTLIGSDINWYIVIPISVLTKIFVMFIVSVITGHKKITKLYRKTLWCDILLILCLI